MTKKGVVDWWVTVNIVTGLHCAKHKAPVFK